MEIFKFGNTDKLVSAFVDDNKRLPKRRPILK